MTREERLPIPLSLGTALRIMRETRNLTLSDVSQISRVSSRSIKRIEQDVQVPRLETVRRLARAFDMTPGEFLILDRRNFSR